MMHFGEFKMYLAVLQKVFGGPQRNRGPSLVTIGLNYVRKQYFNSSNTKTCITYISNIWSCRCDYI